MDQQTPLVCPSHTTQYIGAVIVGIIVGAGASFVYFKQAPAPAGTENTYQAGFDAAKKLVLESPMGMVFRTPDDVRALSGSVTAVNGDKITIHTQSTNPFADPALTDRTITITADTKIVKLSQKDPKVMQAEMAAFMKTMQAGKVTTKPVTPPTPYTSTVVTSADIAVGATLSVTARENIKNAKEFSASEIQIQQNMASPIAPPAVAPNK